MTMFVWRPFRSALAVRPLFQPVTRSNVMSSSPAFDVTEDAEGYTVQAAMPGVSPEDLVIELDGQVLMLRGEVKGTQQGEGVRTRLQERTHGEFARSFRFALPLNADAVQSDYTHGLLTLRLPKADSIKPRRISVQTQPAQATSQPSEQTSEPQAA